MVAVLHNQVIHITIIASSLTFNKFSNLTGIQLCSPNEYRLPELEPWALPWFNFKDTTAWIVMSSKCIFYTMNCKV